MAKKQSIKLNAYNAEVRPDGDGKSILIINGNNSNGTDIEVKISMEDYFFPDIIKDMAKIGKQRVVTANKRMEEIKDAVNNV